MQLNLTVGELCAIDQSNKSGGMTAAPAAPPYLLDVKHYPVDSWAAWQGQLHTSSYFEWRCHRLPLHARTLGRRKRAPREPSLKGTCSLNGTWGELKNKRHFRLITS